MDVMNTFLSEQPIQQIGWVLVHFLWQGCAVMALIWCAMKALGKTSANMRYITACFGLGLMVLSPVVTFLAMKSPTSIAATDSGGFQSTTVAPALQEIEDISQEIIISYAEPTVHKKQLQNVLNSTIEPALPYCVMGWVLGVGGLSLWYLGGWHQLQKLRRVGIKSVSDAIKEKTLELAQRLGIRRVVRVVESVLVQAPTVIGWLEPIILLPASALTGLNEVQLKALIAHELAHIKRCDYIVNIVQTVIEILGFYHPAVWWVSCQVRIERENCCDDIAVALLQDRKEYAKALFSMEEIRWRQLDLAVAANGGQLQNRIGRLIGEKSTPHEKPGWIPIAVICGLMTALIFSVAVTAQTPGELPERILHFPTEYSLGRILIQDDTLQRTIQTFEHWIDNAPWEPLGPAIGNVHIPVGKRVQLIINSITWESPEKLAPLKNLKADDIHTLILSPYWSAGKAPTEKCIPYIQHLTGLKMLDLSGTAVTQQGLKLLSNMKQLERIGVPDNLSNGGLAILVKMQSLKAIHFCRQCRHRLTDKGISLLAQLPQLEELELLGEGLTDEGLSHLPRLTSLNYLYLNAGRFSPKGFASIAAIPNLRIARIYTDNCGDDGLRQLARHPKLERLSVHWLRDITDQGVYYVTQMPSLKMLDVGSANLTNRGLEYLSQNKKIEWLVLPSVRYVNENQPVDAFTDEGIAQLAKMKNLKYLEVSASSRSPLTDSSLSALSGLSGLEELWIGGMGFTDAGMKDLSKLKNLKELVMGAAPEITDEGLAQLSSLYNLESFNWMGNSKVTFAGLNRLSGLKKLKRLDFVQIQRGTAALDLNRMDSLEDLRLSLPQKHIKNHIATYTESFTDADMACISRQKKLSYLSLCGNGISDTGLQYLSDLDNLTTLFLYGQSQITDDGLEYLSGSTRLWQLHIKDGHFTNYALDTLAKLGNLENLELTSDTAFSNSAVKAFRTKAKNIQQLKLDVNADGRQSNRDGAYGGIAAGPSARRTQ